MSIYVHFIIYITEPLVFFTEVLMILFPGCIVPNTRDLHDEQNEPRMGKCNELEGTAWRGKHDCGLC